MGDEKLEATVIAVLHRNNKLVSVSQLTEQCNTEHRLHDTVNQWMTGAVRKVLYVYEQRGFVVRETHDGVARYKLVHVPGDLQLPEGD